MSKEHSLNRKAVPGQRRTGSLHTGAQIPQDRQAWLRERIAQIRMGKPDTRARKLGIDRKPTPDTKDPETPE